MEPELVNLQRRVAELEKALIQVSAHRRRPAMWAATAGAVAGALVMAAAGARVFAQPGLPPPSKVTAPFEVVDGRGRTLFKVQMSASGAGLGLFFDDAGQEAAIIGKASGSDKPTFQVVRKGVLVAGLGTSEGGGGGDLALYDSTGRMTTAITSSGDSGMIRVMSKGIPRIEMGVANQSESGSMSLFSKSKAETIIVGDAGVRQTNAQGNPAAQFGVDNNSNGYVMAANPGGLFLSKLGVASNGSSGRVEVSGGGEIKVLMGVLDNGKGDLCATGSPGRQVCVSGLAVKTMTPY